jgi:hypothetical protein
MRMASITGASRSRDCSSPSTNTRRTVSSGGAPGAPSMPRSLSVSASDQGRKSTAPMCTGRPSSALAAFSPCHFSSGGTASQASTHSASRLARAMPRRRRQRRWPGGRASGWGAWGGVSARGVADRSENGGEPDITGRIFGDTRLRPATTRQPPATVQPRNGS